MAQQDLKKLSRAELVQLVQDMERTMEQLQDRIAQMERQQRERTVHLKKFGSIAESAMQLNGVFDAAQKAADQYLQSAMQLQEKSQREKETADQLLAETQRKCEEMTRTTEESCRQMREEALAEAQGYWGQLEQELCQKLEDYVPSWYEDAQEDPEPTEETPPETMTDEDDGEDDEDDEDE